MDFGCGRHFFASQSTSTGIPTKQECKRRLLTLLMLSRLRQGGFENSASPGDFPGNSYFSPTNDSPTSTRSISQQSFSQFTRQQTAAGHWPHEENKHRAAPAIGLAPSREGPASPNSYVLSGRAVTRPSLPVMAASQHPQQQLIQQNRLRSASTPDIHNPNGYSCD